MMEKLERRMVKRFVGEDRDEYQQMMIYKVLGKSAMYVFYLLSTLMMISLVIDIIHHSYSFGTFALFGILEFMSFYIMRGTRKMKVTDTEYDNEEDYRKCVQELRKKNAFAGVNWGFSMYIFMSYIMPALSGRPLRFRWIDILIWGVAGFLFGGTMYLISKSQISLVLKEEE